MAEDTSVSPNDQLADLVAEKLTEEGLISSDRKDQVLSGLKAGSLKGQDWRLLLEIAADGEEGEDGQAD